MASERVTFSGSVRFGDDIELDLRAYELRRGGRPLKLERIPMELLLLLVERRGELVTRDQIVERIWSKDVFLDTDNSINAAIRKIRQVLKDDPERPRYVQTVTGRGYRFIAAVEDSAQPAPPVVPPFTAVPTTLPSPESQPDAGSLIGKKIAHYRVLKVLGGGGMGVVYQAEDLKLGRRVALKFLPAELASDPNAYRRMQSEARAASALDHPNICAIYELGEHEGMPFIAMQLLEGQTLREWIETRTGQPGPLPMEEVLDLAIQIASGLEAAHQQGMVHRDIKPANIIINSRGTARILDFGVAKFVNTPDDTHGVAIGSDILDTKITRTGISVGTPSYSSPEQLRGEKLDGRSDLFSLGLILYEMATGVRAFPGKTAEIVREGVLNHPAKPIRQLNPALCPELEKIVERALVKDPDRRYQSAAELRTDLERLRASLRVSPAPTDVRRNGWLIGAAVVAIIALVALYFVKARHSAAPVTQVTGSASQVKARRSLAVLGFKNLSGKEDAAWLSSALAEMFATEFAAGQQVRVVADENVARMKKDLSLPAADSFSKETLARIYQQSGADVVVAGSYLVTGEGSERKVRVDLRIQDTQAGETISVASDDGQETDLATLVSRAGSGVRGTLGLGAISGADAGTVRAAIPANPEAARLYAEGLASLHNMDPLAARGLLERAIAVDPKHALSYSALAQALSALGYDKKAADEAKRALDLSAGLSRADRLLVEGHYRELTRDYPAAIEIYRTLRNFFPDDLDYALSLAKAQFKADLIRDAAETLARARAMPEPVRSDPRIDLAEAYLNESLGDFRHTQQLASAAAAKGKAMGSRLLVAQALEREGWAWSELGDPVKSMNAYEESRRVASEAGDTYTVAVATMGKARVAADKSDNSTAHQWYDEALTLFRQLGTQQKIAFTLSDIGSLYYAEGKLALSRQYQTQALQIDREIGNPIARDLGNLANVVAAMGDLKQALEMRTESAKSFQEEGDKRNYAVNLSNIGGEYLQLGDLKLARQYLDKAIVTQEEIGNKRGLAFSQAYVADVLRAQDRLDEARAMSQKTIALRQELKDTELVAESQLQAAEIALDQGNIDEAESLVRSSAAVFDADKVPDVGAVAYADLARVQLARHNLPEAQAAVNRALSYAQQGGDIAGHFEAMLASAELKTAAGKNADAIKIVNSLLAEAKHGGNVALELRFRVALGKIEMLSGNTATGRSQLEKVRDDSQRQGFHLLARQASAALKSA